MFLFVLNKSSMCCFPMLPQSEERYILYFCKECHRSIFNMNSNALFLLRNKSAQTTLPLGNFLFETVLIEVKLRWNFNAINVINKKKEKKDRLCSLMVALVEQLCMIYSSKLSLFWCMPSIWNKLFTPASVFLLLATPFGWSVCVNT